MASRIAHTVAAHEKFDTACWHASIHLMGTQKGKRQVVVYLPEVAYRRLRRRAAQAGTSMSALVDQALSGQPAEAYPVRQLSRAPEHDLSPAAAALVKYGGPFVGRGESSASLEEAVALGVGEARELAAIPRVLVVVIAKNRKVIRWSEVQRLVPRDQLPVLGAMVDLAASATEDNALHAYANQLDWDVGTRTLGEPFPSQPSLARYAMALQTRTPAEMLRWGFVSATPLSDYVEAVRRFC